MNVRLLSAVKHADYIQKVKEGVVAELGINPNTVATKVFNHRLYLGLCDNDAERPLGLFEAEFYDQVFVNSAHSPLSHMPELAKHCGLNELASLRTIYVDPRLRCKSAGYLFLYLAMAVVLHRLSARFAIATTATRNSHLIDLYRKTGGRYIAKYSCATDPDAQAVIAFSVQQTLNSPRIRRVVECMEIDDVELREIRRRKPSALI
jgi:hypothetical protein